MRKIILPLNGYATGQALLRDMRRILSSTDICNLLAFVKINDGIHFMDSGGPKVFQSIHFELANRNLPIGIFLDLKIFAVSATLENVLKKYTNVFSPDVLTVCSSCSVDGIIKLRQLLPNTKLAMVSVLTDISEKECISRYGKTPTEKITADLLGIKHCYSKKICDDKKLSKLNQEPFDMIYCSPYEVTTLKSYFNMYEFIIQGVRDEWMNKPNEHQKRFTGIRIAIENGATYVVMNDQLVKGNPEKGVSSEKSCQQTKTEIQLALAKKETA